MATNNWCLVDDIDVYNGDLIMAITEVTVGNKILTENYLISSVDLFKLNPKKTRLKCCYKREMGHLSFLRERSGALDGDGEQKGRQ